MKRAFLFMTLSCLLFTIKAHAQIDTDLEHIHLSDFKHFTEINLESGEVEYENTKNKGESKVLLFKPLYLQKGKGSWYYDADSCDLQQLKAIKLAYLAEGTKAIYCGISFDAGVKNRKFFRAVSYPIMEELSVGDTLRFTLTLLADKNKTFQPMIYTSAKLKARRGRLKNGKYIEYWGDVPKGSSGDQDLVRTTVEIPITEENKDISWVHVVNNENEMHKGFIIQNDFKKGELDDGFMKVYFGNDSYTINKKGKDLLNQIVNESDSTSSISLRGYADPSGAKSYNMKLAEKRAKAVREYLISKGVDPRQITIEDYDILHNRKARENRICTILVL